MASAQLKLWYAAGVDYPNYTANSVQQIKTAHALARQGARVHFWFKDSQNLGLSPGELLELYDLSPNPEFVMRVIQTQPGRWRYREFNTRFLAQAFSAALGGEFDVLFTRGPQLAMAFKLLTGWRGSRVVFEAHDLADRELAYRGISRRTRRFQRLALRAADGVVTVTDYAKHAMAELGLSPERICVAPDAADPFPVPALRLSLQEAPIRLVYAGSLHWDKGCKTLLEALNHLPETLASRVHLQVIGGKPDQVTQLRTWWEQHRKQGHVSFTGHVPQVQVRGFLARGDILVQPLAESHFARTYASPLKMFEYMAAHRPIICSDVPSLREVVGEEHVRFFTPSDAGDLARVIEHTVDDWRESGRRAENAHKLFLECFTYDARAKMILTFCHDVIHSNEA